MVLEKEHELWGRISCSPILGPLPISSGAWEHRLNPPPPQSSVCALRGQSPSPGCCHHILRKCQGARAGPSGVPPLLQALSPSSAVLAPQSSPSAGPSPPNLFSVASNNTPTASGFPRPRPALSAGLGRGSGVRLWQNSLPLGCRTEVPLSRRLGGGWGAGGGAQLPVVAPRARTLPSSLYTEPQPSGRASPVLCPGCRSTSLCLGTSPAKWGSDSTHFPGSRELLLHLPRVSCSPGQGRRGPCAEGRLQSVPRHPSPPHPEQGPPSESPPLVR